MIITENYNKLKMLTYPIGSDLVFISSFFRFYIFTSFSFYFPCVRLIYLSFYGRVLENCKKKLSFKSFELINAKYSLFLSFDFRFFLGVF